jgi:aminoglycoside phosphotransferase (APT) family kinase protein
VGEPWDPEQTVDAALARALIEAQFPDLAPAQVAPLGVGWDNSAFLVGGTWVFRFPRRAVAVPLLERETRLLPALAPCLPLPIPVPQRVGRPGPAFPWPFAGYLLLPGRTACAAALDDRQRAVAAGPLGAFLAALHAFPVAEAAARGAGADEIGRTDVPARTAKARGTLAELDRLGLLDPGGRARLERVLDAAPTARPGADRVPPVLVHGDLYVRHVLVDARARPAGVIDWGDVHLGERAVDLALAHWCLPPAAHETFRRAYGPIDDDTWRLAAFRAAYHAASVVRYAQRVGDADLLREGRLALRWLAAS